VELTIYYLEAVMGRDGVTVQERSITLIGDDLAHVVGRWMALRYSKPKVLILGNS